MEKMEIKVSHFALNRAHLEQAVLEQASLFAYYATEQAKQQSRTDILKNALEYKSATLKIQIRQHAEAAKIKLTQDQVDSALIVEPEIVQLKNEILEAEEYLAQLKAATTAMMHKRDSIENEIRLVLSARTMTDGDCNPDTKYAAQCKAVEQATAASMVKNPCTPCLL